MYYRSPFAITLVVVTLVLLTAGLTAWHFLSIKSTGLPLGPAMRLPNHIVQIIHTTERYLPTLHRNPDKDRFRLDLLVIPIADPTKMETITLLRQQHRNALQPMTKILGGDGDVIWVQALDLFAVNLKTKRVTRLADLKKLNPELELFLTTAKFDFENRLIAVSPDRQQAYAVTADSFKATPSPVPNRSEWPNLSVDVKDWLCAGGVFTPTEWFGALGAKDAADRYRAGERLPADFPVNPKNESRHLYRGLIKTEDNRSQFPTLERLGTGEYREAAFIRSGRLKPWLRLSESDSVLFTYRSGGAAGSLLLERIGSTGKSRWTTDTGIGTLRQVLPDTNVLALVGERPPVPNKVSEPILVLVNTVTGATNTVSLWR